MDQQTLIERVVAEVMGQLMARSASTNGEKVGPLQLKETIITADLLAESAKRSAVIEVTQRAIVTPSARDWLRHNKVELIRGNAPAAVQGTAQSVANLAIVQAGSENLDRVLGSVGWNRELVGTADEAAKLAISEVCRGGVKRVVIFSRDVEVVACFANRNEKVRAAAVTDVAGVKRVKSALSGNVFVVDPT